MGRIQEALLDKLLRLADGDIGLLERAFRDAQREGGAPGAIEDGVLYLLEAREPSKQAQSLREMLRTIPE